MIQSLRFLEIDDIKLNLGLPTILNSEVEPLQMSPRIGIDPYIEVILILPHFDDSIEISTFEIALENQFSVFLDGRIHAFEDSCIFGFEIGMELSKICSHMLKVGVD